MAKKINLPKSIKYKSKDIQVLVTYDKKFENKLNKALEVSLEEAFEVVNNRVNDYVPIDKGGLTNSKKISDGNDLSKITTWEAVYAEIVYNNPIKSTTLKGKRGPQWDKRMFNDYKVEIANKAITWFKKTIK